MMTSLASLALSAQSSGGEPAQYNLKIDAEPLSDALQDFARQSGIQIIFFSKVAEGRVAHALNGKFTAQGALRILLGDSALTFREINPTTIEVRPVSAANTRTSESTEIIRVADLRGSESPAPHARTDDAASAQAFAADAASDTLQEVIVTAEKRRERLQDVPLSITAYSGDELVARGFTSISQVGAETPGVSQRSGGPGQTEFEMRGIASGGGQSPTVGFYFDEIPLTPPTMATGGKVVIDPSLYDLDGVEILRGPQGTLYGSGSMGGTIKIVANQPNLQSFGGNAEVIGSGTASSGASYGGNVMLNIPLIDDVLAVRIVGTDKYTDGWIDRRVLSPFPLETDGGATRGSVTSAPVAANYTDVNWEKLQGVRATVLAHPTDRLSLSTTYFYQRINQGGLNYADNPPGVDAEAHYQPFDVSEPFSDSFNLASLTIKYDFDAFQVTSATGQYRRTTHAVEDTSEYLADFFAADIGIPGLPYSATGAVAAFDVDRSKQTTEELRLTSTGNGSFQWLVGGFLQDFDTSSNVTTNTPGPIVNEVFGVPSLFDVNFATNLRQYAGFGEASYRFLDQFKVTGGLRYFYYESRQEVTSSGGLITGSLTPEVTELPASDSGVNPKFNFSYQPAANVMIYTQAAKGFRPGSANAPPPSTCASTASLQFKPDSLWSYEIGEKIQLFDGRVSINGAVYYENWKKIQQQVSEPCGYGYTANAGVAEVRGGELEITGRLIRGLTLSTGAGYTNAKITQTVPGSSFVVGEKIQQVPTWTDTTTMVFQKPILPGYDFIARATNEYVGPMTDVTLGVNNLPGHDLINLRAGLMSHDGLTLFLFVDNAADRRYALDNSIARFTNVPALSRVVTNQPRTIGLDLTYRFGAGARSQ